MKKKLSLLALAAALSAVAAVWIAASPAGASSAGGGTQIPLAGMGSPQTGDFTSSGAGDVTQAEFPGQGDEADGSPGPYPGTIVDRLSRRVPATASR